MYHFNKRLPRKKKRYAVLRFLLKFAVFVVVVAGIWLYLKRPRVNINDSGTRLTPAKFDEPATRHIAEPLFGLDLPGDWKEIDRRSSPYNLITWKGTSKESTARTLDVYIDKLPQDLAVNRVLPVSGEDDRLAVSPASENCVTFSPETVKLSPAEAAKLKPLVAEWQKIKFICDIPNSLRNLLATGSVEGINKVSVTGPKGGKHTYLLIYNDGSAHPDEKTFPDILRSFRAL